MHVPHNVIFFVYLIFLGAATFGALVLFARQTLLIAYIFSGMLFGPFGLKLIPNVEVVHSIGDVGILFLLFLLGLHLPPQKLIHMLRKISWVGMASSIVFFLFGFILSWIFNFKVNDCILVGLGLMFSSTIIGIKLLPTTVLHHQHTGELMISVLLWQDILAIVVMILIRAFDTGGHASKEVVLVLIGFPSVLLMVYVSSRWLLIPLLARFSRIKEYVFLLAIAWCLSIAELSTLLGLSSEVGAFIAGVSLAMSPIALYIAESLKPLRDFFLVLFFFAVGANFDWHYLPVIIVPALLIAIGVLIIKPFIYRWLLSSVEETKEVAWEVGVRLGQVSEFALIIAFMALSSQLMTVQASYLIQAAFIISSVLSGYWVVLKYPSPVAMNERLRRD
ncbi:MAG: sodium:proton antiporter [Coxiellaceae bacterium]|nr:sodium:proton antiporter [Coxiellaceae bacterium]